MATLNLSLVIRAIDRATAPARRVREALRGLENNRGLRTLRSYAEAGGKALRFAGRQAMNLVKWASALAGVGLTAFGFSIFRTGIQYEKFLAQLETTEGSASKARSAMGWVQKFAATTPYELATVMDAFIKLRAYGIDPTDGTLRTLGDTSSSMGKDLLAAVEALADAQTGEFERLKEFGVKARVQGDKVRFTYTLNNKAMVVSAKNSGEEIRKALMGIWDTRFAGGMVRQSKTLGGILSNLMDWWTGFKRQIGDAGVFDYVKGKVAGFLDSLQTPAGAAKAAEWAKKISDGMIRALKILEDAFKDFDLGKFISDLASIVAFAAKVVQFLGGIGGVIDTVVVGAIAHFGWVIGSVAVAIGAFFGIAAAPIIAVVAAITAVIAVGYLLVRRWGAIRAWFGKMWTRFTENIATQAGKWAELFQGMWERAKSIFAAGVRAVWGILPGWFRALIVGGLKLAMMLHGVDVGGRGAAPAARPGTPRPPRLGGAWDGTQGPRADFANRLDGRIVVELQGSGQSQVKSVRSTGTTDLDLMMDRGLGLQGGF